MAHADAVRLGSTPMSVEQLVSAADEPFFEAFFSTKNWFRTAHLMIKQANIYERQGDLQTAYFLLYRHARLILEFLPRHPEASDTQYRQAWIDARKDVQRSLSKLEDLKPWINQRHEKYQDGLRAENDRRSAHPSTERKDDWISRPIDPGEIANKAVRFVSAQNQPRNHTKGHKNGNGPSSSALDGEEDYHSSVLSAGRKLQYPTGTGGSNSWENTSQGQARVNYPAVPEGHQTAPLKSHRHDAFRISSIPVHTPKIPPKVPDLGIQTPPSPSTPPSIPSKSHEAPFHRPASTPSPSADLDPFPNPAHTENNVSLRTLFLPSSLQAMFLAQSHDNTTQNLETCSIIVGTLLQNALFTTHLIFPPQTATPDSCEMTDESALQSCIESLEQKEGRDLLVLGWIHTHPRQTCFLSSADLHTHVWYQASLPESVAVVCAPEKGERRYGVFRLTDGPGLGVVRDCRREGTFHPHDCEGLYTDASGWPMGHVIEQEGLDMALVDLRA